MKTYFFILRWNQVFHSNILKLQFFLNAWRKSCVFPTDTNNVKSYPCSCNHYENNQSLTQKCVWFGYTVKWQHLHPVTSASSKWTLNLNCADINTVGSVIVGLLKPKNHRVQNLTLADSWKFKTDIQKHVVKIQTIVCRVARPDLYLHNETELTWWAIWWIKGTYQNSEAQRTDSVEVIQEYCWYVNKYWRLPAWLLQLPPGIACHFIIPFWSMKHEVKLTNIYLLDDWWKQQQMTWDLYLIYSTIPTSLFQLYGT